MDEVTQQQSINSSQWEHVNPSVSLLLGWPRGVVLEGLGKGAGRALLLLMGGACVCVESRGFGGESHLQGAGILEEKSHQKARILKGKSSTGSRGFGEENHPHGAGILEKSNRQKTQILKGKPSTGSRDLEGKNSCIGIVIFEGQIIHRELGFSREIQPQKAGTLYDEVKTTHRKSDFAGKRKHAHT